MSGHWVVALKSGSKQNFIGHQKEYFFFLTNQNVGIELDRMNFPSATLRDGLL